jgi:hypothetical protein
MTDDDLLDLHAFLAEQEAREVRTTLHLDLEDYDALFDDNDANLREGWITYQPNHPIEHITFYVGDGATTRVFPHDEQA